MAWIESHDSLGEHPKLNRLSSFLKVGEATAIGHLHYLWWWCLKFADDGNLTGFSPREIARASHWRGSPDRFLTGLLQCGIDSPGFLEQTTDGKLIVHDWTDYAGRLVAKREANKLRMRETRAAHSHGTTYERADNVEHTERARVRLPYPTVPYPTVPENRESATPPKKKIDQAFRTRMYALYPQATTLQIDESIDDALAHKSSDKWKDQRRYVQKWLARGMENGVKQRPSFGGFDNSSEKYRKLAEDLGQTISKDGNI